MSTPLVLDGKALAKSVEQELAARVQRIKEKTGVTPILATILVGNDPASVTYVRMK
ncbi:MAG: bifunctional 5,10-methylene-tetrahydrofolate dehydrogenase/5,10-methylene-tetrahydrofolate cyclohydrolase, partial [Clostridiaceae bacterium]|nr:bifunctional 5,10-methylene-tetrahydrofolate dehydrogenase/5,10-methylene-tetrahydrofolate cyclohydrolase [Clostridiaceae bacterium]